MLVNRWAVTKGCDKGTMVELFRFDNGEEYYIGRTRWGEPFYIADEVEAQKIINVFEMELVY